MRFNGEVKGDLMDKLMVFNGEVHGEVHGEVFVDSINKLLGINGVVNGVHIFLLRSRATSLKLPFIHSSNFDYLSYSERHSRSSLVDGRSTSYKVGISFGCHRAISRCNSLDNPTITYEVCPCLRQRH